MPRASRVDRLIRRLSSHRARTRAVAAFRLGELRAQEAEAALEEAMEDRSPLVRTLAAWAVAAIRGLPVRYIGDALIDEHGGLDAAGLSIVYDSLRALLRDEESGRQSTDNLPPR